MATNPPVVAGFAVVAEVAVLKPLNCILIQSRLLSVYMDSKAFVIKVGPALRTFPTLASIFFIYSL